MLCCYCCCLFVCLSLCLFVLCLILFVCFVRIFLYGSCVGPVCLTRVSMFFWCFFGLHFLFQLFCCVHRGSKHTVHDSCPFSWAARDFAALRQTVSVRGCRCFLFVWFYLGSRFFWCGFGCFCVFRFLVCFVFVSMLCFVIVLFLFCFWVAFALAFVLVVAFDVAAVCLFLLFVCFAVCVLLLFVFVVGFAFCFVLVSVQSV